MVNRFIAFTEDTLAWIEEVIHSSSQVPPHEFGARAFMERRAQQAQQIQHEGSVNNHGS